MKFKIIYRNVKDGREVSCISSADYTIPLRQVLLNLYSTRNFKFVLHCSDEIPSFEILNFRGSKGDYSSTLVPCLQVFQIDTVPKAYEPGREAKVEYSSLSTELNKPAWIMKTPDGITLEEFYIREGNFHRTNGPAMITNTENGKYLKQDWIYHGWGQGTTVYVIDYCAENGLDFNALSEEDAEVMYNIWVMKNRKEGLYH